MSKKQIIELDTQEAVALATERIESINDVMELKVNSDPTYQEAASAMGVIREAKKFLKEKKDSILKPLKLAKENIESLFEKPENRLMEIETHLKGQIDPYAAKLRQKEAEQLAEAQKKINAGVPVEVATKVLGNTQKKVDKIPTYTVWNVEIVDFSKVPDEFKVLNESKAKEAGKAGLKVEGLKIWSEEKTKNLY